MKTFGALLEAARIQSEINRLFDNLLDLGGTGETGEAWIPTADICETEDTLVVKVELPGVEPGDLRLMVHGGNVIVEGEKKRLHGTDEGKGHVVERGFGRFRRVINLGIPVNTHRAEAVLADGLLRIRFPKVPNRRGEEVPIEVKPT